MLGQCCRMLILSSSCVGSAAPAAAISASTLCTPACTMMGLRSISAMSSPSAGRERREARGRRAEVVDVAGARRGCCRAAAQPGDRPHARCGRRRTAARHTAHVAQRLDVHAAEAEHDHAARTARRGTCRAASRHRARDHRCDERPAGRSRRQDPARRRRPPLVAEIEPTPSMSVL